MGKTNYVDVKTNKDYIPHQQNYMKRYRLRASELSSSRDATPNRKLMILRGKTFKKDPNFMSIIDARGVKRFFYKDE